MGKPRRSTRRRRRSLLTSMDRDGTREGFDLELTRAVVDAVPIPVIASGGVGNLSHLADGVIEGGADAVLAASIFPFWRVHDRRGQGRRWQHAESMYDVEPRLSANPCPRSSPTSLPNL